MLKHCVAGVFVLSVITCSAAFAGPDRVKTVVAPLPETIKAEARWSRAERDRTNEILARDFIAANQPADRKWKDVANPEGAGKPQHPQ